jgi:hypothetical protein
MLSIDAPAWVKPADAVTVKLTAASYIGSGELTLRAYELGIYTMFMCGRQSQGMIQGALLVRNHNNASRNLGLEEPQSPG